VQVVADIDGSVISLSGTDRSICIKGRRVIAEGPPAAVPAPLLARMETHAVEFSRLVSAATVPNLRKGWPSHCASSWRSIRPQSYRSRR